MTKLQLRNHINERRVEVSDVIRNKAAQQATELFVHDPLFTESENIACYLARTEEFDTTPIIQAIWAANKNCYLPVLSTEEEGYLKFVLYRPTDVLRLNRYRILEPEHTEVIATEKLDVVIMPLVGFDKEGNRLGAGGGYYDRTFAFMRKSETKSPILIGLAYEFQRVQQLPVDEWDVPMHGLITEQRRYSFSFHS